LTNTLDWNAIYLCTELLRTGGLHEGSFRQVNRVEKAKKGKIEEGLQNMKRIMGTGPWAQPNRSTRTDYR